MKNQTEKQNVYEIITDKIIEQLNAGIVPWHKPWVGTGQTVNYVSRKPYSQLNELLLGRAGEYLTMKQCSSLGGRVKDEELKNYSIVTFWKPQVKVHKEINDEGEEIEVVDGIKGFILRFYNVWHIDQCEGIETKFTDEERGFDNDPIEEAEEVIANYDKRESHLTIKRTFGSNRAFFSPSQDLVVVPDMKQFEDVNEFYSTLFHELVHSTGIKTRCDRGLEECAAFGSETYSKEELVAEIGSAMTINVLGIDAEKAFKNSIAYLQGWAKVLKNDPRLIVNAAKKAEEAVKYMMKK